MRSTLKRMPAEQLIDSTELPTGQNKVDAVRNMFDAIAPRYDLVNRLMTFRMDVSWRQRAIGSLGLAPGSVVADLACGTGDLCFDLEQRSMTAIGVDLSFGMLKAAPRPFPRVQADALRLPFADGQLDGVTCGFALRNFESLTPFCAEIARVIRPKGRISLLEVFQPSNPVLAAGHRIYFQRVVPFIGAIFSDRSAYSYLPKSVAYLPPTDQLLSMIRDAGFVDVHHVELSGGITQLITATRAA